MLPAHHIKQNPFFRPQESIAHAKLTAEVVAIQWWHRSADRGRPWNATKKVTMIQKEKHCCVNSLCAFKKSHPIPEFFCRTTLCQMNAHYKFKQNHETDKNAKDRLRRSKCASDSQKKTHAEGGTISKESWTTETVVSQFLPNRFLKTLKLFKRSSNMTKGYYIKPTVHHMIFIKGSLEVLTSDYTESCR